MFNLKEKQASDCPSEHFSAWMHWLGALQQCRDLVSQKKVNSYTKLYAFNILGEGVLTEFTHLE